MLERFNWLFPSSSSLDKTPPHLRHCWYIKRCWLDYPNETHILATVVEHCKDSECLCDMKKSPEEQYNLAQKNTRHVKVGQA